MTTRMTLIIGIRNKRLEEALQAWTLACTLASDDWDYTIRDDGETLSVIVESRQGGEAYRLMTARISNAGKLITRLHYKTKDSTWWLTKQGRDLDAYLNAMVIKHPL